MIMAR